MITIDHVSRTFGGAVRALDDVSIHVRRGEVFGVVGQSGAGKSTLLRTVNALERPDSGTVTVDDVEVSALRGRALLEARHRIGMVFQHFNLVGNRTAAQNVEFALEAVGRPGAAKRGEALRDARPRRPRAPRRRVSRPSSRAGSGSASASPARSQRSPPCSSPTRRRAPSTPTPPARSSV